MIVYCIFSVVEGHVGSCVVLIGEARIPENKIDLGAIRPRPFLVVIDVKAEGKTSDVHIKEV